MSALDFVAQIGRHARVSPMLARENVKARLASPDGLSFAEFAYQLFQAYDFYHLARHHGCRVQLGGSDQWGNITAGIDLIHRLTAPNHDGAGQAAYGVVLPLLTDSRGEKFGKSAGNAVWLDAERTSPYELYQYFFNVADADAVRLLRLLTFVPLDELDEIAQRHQAAPEAREAQIRLAAEMTEMVHGRTERPPYARSSFLIPFIFLCIAEAARGAATVSHVLFDDASPLSSSSPVERTDLLRFAPHVTLARGELLGRSAASLAVVAGLCASLGEAGRLAKQGALRLNGTVVADPRQPIGEEDLVRGWLVLRAGKRTFKVLRAGAQA